LVKKFFPLDKNYLLEQAQLHCEKSLLQELIALVKSRYESTINPLGLVDSFTAKIRNYQSVGGIYRFKHGDNQLQFLWDGNDHHEHYRNEWSKAFMDWTTNFCRHDLFIQAILDLSVFLPENKSAQMIENRMQHFIEKHFEVKFHPKKGLIAA
jgi:hypothetical protein